MSIAKKTLSKATPAPKPVKAAPVSDKAVTATKVTTAARPLLF